MYGKQKAFDVERMIDMLQALEKFVAVKDYGDGSAFKVDGVRGDVYVGTAGEALGTKKVLVNNDDMISGLVQRRKDPGSSTTTNTNVKKDKSAARDALKFFFDDDGAVFREFVLGKIIIITNTFFANTNTTTDTIDEVCNGVDAISRDAARELFVRLNIRGNLVPPLFRALAPKLTEVIILITTTITIIITYA